MKGGMGFRDFELCVRVFKGKHFPHTDFLHATAQEIGHLESYHCRESSVRDGLIKQVVSGSRILVWTDKWISKTATFTHSRRISNDHIDKVLDLINTKMGGWKVELLRWNFFHLTLMRYLTYHYNGGEDFLAWALERSGNHSVKFAKTSSELRRKGKFWDLDWQNNS